MAATNWSQTGTEESHTLLWPRDRHTWLLLSRNVDESFCSFNWSRPNHCSKKETGKVWRAMTQTLQHIFFPMSSFEQSGLKIPNSLMTVLLYSHIIVTWSGRTTETLRRLAKRRCSSVECTTSVQTSSAGYHRLSERSKAGQKAWQGTSDH